MEVEIRFKNHPELRKPYLICGLPGIAYVGKLSVDHLIKELNAKLFAEIYSKYFPPYVLIENGLVELLRNELFYLSDNKFERDYLFYTGNIQAATPEGQHIISNKVLDVALEHGCERVYSIAASLSRKTKKKPRVFAAVTNKILKKELKSSKVVMMGSGTIGGTNGLMLGLSKMKNLQGICLLGETKGLRTVSGEYLMDANAVRAVLKVLLKTLNISVDLSPLEEKIEKMKKTLEKIAKVEEYVIKKQREAVTRDYKNYIT